MDDDIYDPEDLHGPGLVAVLLLTAGLWAVPISIAFLLFKIF